MKTVTIDIDGLLNNYPKCWLDFIYSECHEKFATIAEAKTKLGEEYKLVKDKYRTSGYKSTLPVNPQAVTLINNLKSKGYKIIVATSRPFDKYPNLRDITFNWLKSNNFEFDVLESKNQTLIDKYNPVFHIDDELAHVMFYLENSIKVYLLKRADLTYNNCEKFETLKVITSLDEVLVNID